MTDDKYLKKNINKTNRKSKKTNSHENVHINYNWKGEKMERGEIDDMYDDGKIVERELESLLTSSKN